MKFSKKLLSLLLCAVMVLGSVAIGGGGFAEVLDAFSVKASATKVTSYKAGDIIEFGWYPQTKETDSSIISSLNATGGEWISYNYYCGTGEWNDGQMKPSDYMRYKDVMYGGTKYRGVIFDSYRPYYTGYRSTTSTSSQHQESNGYTCGNVYWFKYEPIKWQILDAKEGLAMCDVIIDCQAYSNTLIYCDAKNETYNGKGAYASDWETSDIRSWLNNDFFTIAFTESEQSQISERNNINTCLQIQSGWDSEFNKYNSRNTSDKVFLLSYQESINSNYGFNENDIAVCNKRAAEGTDYAKCQGLYVDLSFNGNSYWWLRTPNVSYCAGLVSSNGYSCLDYDYVNSCLGIRPVINFSDLSSLTDQKEESILSKLWNDLLTIFKQIYHFILNLFDF